MMANTTPLLWKQSSRTRQLFRRHALFFVGWWLICAAFFMAPLEEWLTAGWTRLLGTMLAFGFLISCILGLQGLRSACKDMKKSANPDPDLAALIDGDITITEFRERKDLSAPVRDLS